jgi:hypothetical protein
MDMRRQISLWAWAALGAAVIGTPLIANALAKPHAASAPPPPPAITVSSTVPVDVNPAGGGAPSATPAQAAAFAWQEFIALNWPAAPQTGQLGQRDKPSTACRFGEAACNGPTVWETFRGKVETFPGNSMPPPGYTSNAAQSYGYDAAPQYNYAVAAAACVPAQQSDPTPWVNLDETTEITLNAMYAGVVLPSSSPTNASPQLIRFLAKSNRAQYVYVARNSSPTDPSLQWWNAIPPSIVTATKAYLAAHQASPPPDSSNVVSQPYGTIEVKAGWRPLNPAEVRSGRFHMQMVRFYDGQPFSPCFRDEMWGLVALHIIQKTPTAPYFIYATFEQADNILTAAGRPVEDANGNIVAPAPATANTPQICLVDPKPPTTAPQTPEVTSALGSVIETANPATCRPVATQTYCSAPGDQIYYLNTASTSSNSEPNGGNICVNKRENAIPDYAVAANTTAHAAIASYLQANHMPSAPWLYYKLVNIQYYPYDKLLPANPTPNGSLYTANPPYTAQNPAPSSYYQANIVVETNRSLQLFAGGLSPSTPAIATEWNADGSPHKNSLYAGHFYNMGGCMGCHGSQGQNPAGQAGDFSVILARGAVILPDVPPATSSRGMTQPVSNRSLK